MKHYDYVEWALYKNNLLDRKLHEEMEEHLYLCDECMEIFLSLIDEDEIKKAEDLISEEFTLQVMDNIKNISPMRRPVKEKGNHKSSKDFFLYYVAVASVAVILTAGGAFGKIIDTVAQINTNISFNDSKLQTNKVYDFSETIVNRTSKFINEFELRNKTRED